MSLGLEGYNGNFAAGTPQHSTGTETIIPAVPVWITAPWALVLLLVYTADGAALLDLSRLRDRGDGWRLLAHGTDLGALTPFSMALFGLIAPRYDAAGYLGLETPDGVPFSYVSCTASFWMKDPVNVPTAARFELGAFGSSDAFVDDASAAQITIPSIQQPYQQVLEVMCTGYSNGGTPRTVSPTGSERFDISESVPGYGIQLCTEGLGGHRNAVTRPAFNLAVSGAVTERVGLRAMVPLVAHVNPMRRRYGQARRIG